MESLERVEVSELETSLSSQNPNPTKPHESRDESMTESRLSSLLRSNGVRDFSFKRVPRDYYDTPIESRREILTAHSIDHICKSIVLVNTQAQASVTDCSDRNNSKYYVVVVQMSVADCSDRNNSKYYIFFVQYTARFNAESVKKFLYSLNNGKIPKKKFNLRLASEEVSLDLTGYEHNGVTCIGMKTSIPVILDEAIAKLEPDFFWLGGGETDLKLGIRTSEFVNFVKPFVVDCSNN